MNTIKIFFLIFASLILTSCLDNTTPLKQTGQNTIYTNDDDAFYQSGIAPSYTREKNTIIDNTTTLQWQYDKTTNTITHKQALLYCKELVLDDEDDWRLPDITELLTIIDYDKIDPSINKVFKNTKSSHYWSSTLYKSDDMLAWGVDFKYGDDFHKDISKTSNVKCVRGENKITSNFKRQKETVIDKNTNLQYQDDNSSQTTKKIFEDAITYCESLTLGGYNNWRLPNITELLHITDKNIRPSINPIFKNTNLSRIYWSSTTDTSSDNFARAVWFSNGGDWIYPKSSPNYTRCVRSVKEQ